MPEQPGDARRPERPPLPRLELWRPLAGALGLALGFSLYALAGRFPAPWNERAVGAMFVLLGVSALLYARGERWIMLLGALLIGWGLLRTLFFR